MRGAEKRTDTAKYLAIAVVAIVLLAVGYGAWVFHGLVAQLNRDCATRPPLEAFENVFGHPPPPGVSDLRAAGRIWTGGRDVYLRFRATDDAILHLTRGSQRAVGANKIKECIESTQMEERLRGDNRWVRWKQRVHWGELLRLPGPECYTLLPRAPSWTPEITLIVDRPHHLVYVYRFDI